MVNQNIEQLLQQAVDQSMAQTQESRELADDVSGLIGEIRTEVAQAVQRTDDAIEDVNAAIPSALDDALTKTIYLDVNAVDDSNDGSTPDKALKTLKAAINAAPRHGSAKIQVASGQTIVVNGDIPLYDQHITLDLAEGVLEQQTLNGYIGRIIQIGDCSFKVTEGKIRTALLDQEVPEVSEHYALFTRSNLQKTRYYSRNVDIELGDQPLVSVGDTCGLHEVAIGFSDLTFRAGANNNHLIIFNHNLLALHVSVVTIPDGYTWSDLIVGEIKAADGVPINVLCNVSLVA